MVLFAQVAVEEELPVDTDGGDEGVRRQFGNVEGVSFPDELRSVIIGKKLKLVWLRGRGYKERDKERARGGMEELELENFIL